MISEWSHFKDNLMQKKTFKNMYGTKMNIWPIKGQNIHFKAQLTYLE